MKLNLSTALSQLGKHGAALSKAHKALNQGKGNNEPLCLFNMGVEFEFLGQLDKALELYTRVKEMAVDSPAFLCLVDKGIAEV